MRCLFTARVENPLLYLTLDAKHHSLPLLAPNIHAKQNPSLRHIPPKSRICRRVAIMDSLIWQMRTKLRAGGPEDRDNINRVSSQRNRSGESWFQMQYSKQMGSNDNNHALCGEDEIAIAIAAAAYAVNSFDKPDHGAKATSGDSSLARAKSKEEMITQQEPYNLSKPLSDQQEPSSKGIQDSSSKEHNTQPKPNNIGDGPMKTVQKRPTFAKLPPQQKLQEEEEEASPIPLQNSKKRTALPPPTPPPPKFPTTKPGDPPLFKIQGQAIAEPLRPSDFMPNPRSKRLVGNGDAGGGASEADDWERDKMAMIKVEHEKLSETIVTWEAEKKKTARHKLAKNERETERTRMKARKEFRTEMERIGQIAGGARAQAEERRRNEELKAKEKPDRIRRTGKARSNACFCF